MFSLTQFFETMAQYGHFVPLPWGATLYLFTGKPPNIQAATVTAAFSQTIGKDTITHTATVSIDTKGVITMSNVT